MMSNFIYFVNFNKLFSIDESSPTVRNDIDRLLEIRYDQYAKNESFGDVNQWRHHIVFMSTIVPPICLTLEILLGKIRIPLRHVWLIMLG